MRFVRAVCSDFSAPLSTVPSGRCAPLGPRKRGGNRGHPDGAVGHSSLRGLGDSCALRRPWGAAEGTATGAGAPPRAEVGRQAPGSVPRLETTPAHPPSKSPREAGPAPGLREEAAGDRAISRGLRGSGSRAEYMSYGTLRPGETEVA